MPRPPRGMFKRGRSYYVRLRSGDRDKWICLGSDYALAVRRLNETQRADAQCPIGASLSVADAAQRWLAEYVATMRGPAGQRNAETRVRRHLVPHLGTQRIDKLTAQLLRGYRLWLEAHQLLQPLTVRTTLADLVCLLRWAHQEAELVSRVRIPRGLLPAIPERPPDRLTDEEVEKVTAIEEPYGFIIRLGLGSGLRWGELTRARADHVRDGVLIVGETKNGRVRRVPLAPALVREIRNRVGRLVPYQPKSSFAFAKVVRGRSDVARFRAHMMRHTFACHWLEQGGSLASLQELLGHTTIRMTQRYGKLTDEAVCREADRLYGKDTVASTVATRDHGVWIEIESPPRQGLGTDG